MSKNIESKAIREARAELHRQIILDLKDGMSQAAIGRKHECSQALIFSLARSHKLRHKDTLTGELIERRRQKYLLEQRFGVEFGPDEITILQAMVEGDKKELELEKSHHVGRFYPSIEYHHIARNTGLTREQIHRAVDSLKDKKLVWQDGSTIYAGKRPR